EKRGARFPLWIEKEDNVAYIELKHAQPLGTTEQGLSLFTDDSLQLKDGYLSVVPEERDAFEEPLAKDADNVVRLNIDSPLIVKDGKLGVDQKELSKGIGAISVYSAMDEILPGVGDWIDIPDLPGDMEEYIGNATLVKLNEETKSDLFESDINTNRSNIIDLNNAKQQMQGDLINLAADLTGTTELLGTIQTAQTAFQAGQALLKGDVTSLQGIATSLAGQVTGLDAALTAYTSLPVVCGVVGIGLMVSPPDALGLVTITNTTGPLMTKPKAGPPVDPLLKSDPPGVKDNEAGETAGPTDSPIPPPAPPPGPPPPEGLKGGGGGGITNGPCYDPIPPIFGGRTNKGEQTWYRDSFGKRWSHLPTVEVDGIRRTVLEYDENNYPIVEAGHIDIILRRNDDEQISSALLTHDRHLQVGYDGVYNEHMQQVPNLAMLFETWRDYMLPYVQSCNYINVGQGLVKDGNTLSLSEDLSAFAKTSSLKGLAFKDTLAYNDLTGRPTLGTLSTKNTLDWNGTDIINKPTDLTTKTYVDGLSYLTAGTGITKSGSTLSLNTSAISSLGALTVNGILTATDNISTRYLRMITSIDGGVISTISNSFQSPAAHSQITFSNGSGNTHGYIRMNSASAAVGDGGPHAFHVGNNIGPLRLMAGYGSTAKGFTITNSEVSSNIPITAGTPTAVGHLTTKGYVDSLSYLTAGTGLTKTGNALAVNPSITEVLQPLSIRTEEYPPAAITANSTTFSGLDYGNGTYIASASAVLSTWFPFRAFDKVGSTSYWASGGYNSVVPISDYTGGITTVVSGTSYSGEWLQLQCPSPFVLTSYTIDSRTTITCLPASWILAGSNDGVTFTMLDERSGITWSNGEAKKFDISNQVPFSRYRMVVRQIHQHGNLVVIDVRLFGSALQVRGDVGASGNIVAGGTVTAATPTVAGHAATKGYVDGLSYLTAGTGLVKTGNTISLGSDLSAFEVKSNLKALAYKDKVDYATDLINVPASVTYGSNLLFSNNTVSLNPVLTGIDSLSATGNLNLG
ncbi:hypothetical protein HDU85_001624, partial [Gaertneriomyces sp. JEL0708]